MSETGLYDVFETPSGKFRRWQTTGTVECMNGGVWRSIPEVAQAEIVRLRAALEAEQWRPIETAPKGKKLIVYGEVPGRRHCYTMMARYWDRHTLDVPDGYEDEDWVDLDDDGTPYMPADWYEEVEGDDAPPTNLRPTHWRPLPLPPFPQEVKT